jgi:hypothetical protein
MPKMFHTLMENGDQCKCSQCFLLAAAFVFPIISVNEWRGRLEVLKRSVAMCMGAVHALEISPGIGAPEYMFPQALCNEAFQRC